MNVTYQHRVALGLCRQCGVSLPANNKYKGRCEACAERMRLTAHARYVKNKEAGTCTGCSGVCAPDHKLCVLCIERSAVRSRNWRERRKSSDRCMYCVEPKWGTAMACQRHYIEKKLVQYKIPFSAVPLLIKRLEDQNNKCFYTGVPLVPGVNMEIDHYYSVARNPDLAADPNNIVWADGTCNNSKRDASVADFIAMCEAIVVNKAAILAGVPATTL